MPTKGSGNSDGKGKNGGNGNGPFRIPFVNRGKLPSLALTRKSLVGILVILCVLIVLGIGAWYLIGYFKTEPKSEPIKEERVITKQKPEVKPSPVPTKRSRSGFIPYANPDSIHSRD